MLLLFRPAFSGAWSHTLSIHDLVCPHPGILTLVKVENFDEYRLWFGGASPSPPVSPRRRRSPEVRPCFVRLEDVTSQFKATGPTARVPSSQFYGAPVNGSARASRKDQHQSASRASRKDQHRSSSGTSVKNRHRSASRASLADRHRGSSPHRLGRSRSVAPPRTTVRDKSKPRRSLSSCSRKMPRVSLGKGKVKAKDDMLRCGLCLMPFHLHSSLRKHVQEHQERAPDRCLVCGAGVVGLADAVLHFLSHKDAVDELMDGDEQGVKCRLCPQRFPRRRRSNLARHVLSHTGELPFKCASCRSAFRTLHGRDNHAERIHGARDAGTSKSAAVVQSVLRRNETLSGQVAALPQVDPDDVVACYYCPLELRSLEQLKQHVVASHGADRPHGCARCPKRFLTRSHALRHEATHSDGFRCSLCGEGFSTAKACLDHVEQAHRGALRGGPAANSK